MVVHARMRLPTPRISNASRYHRQQQCDLATSTASMSYTPFLPRRLGKHTKHGNSSHVEESGGVALVYSILHICAASRTF